METKVNLPSGGKNETLSYFYDPYYGGNGYFTRGEISKAVNLSGFAFLAVSP